uniref:Uncharacterized protein n=1 Tax=Siphoviridae sp. ctx254 TaxID=2825737 RepID=A0A8S5TVK9_9CAUD|nr:MAG TPA: hypothetical protein [Siphoviridae sp. ctx254]
MCRSEPILPTFYPFCRRFILRIYVQFDLKIR